MFDDYLVRKQVVVDYKILILNSGHIVFSQTGQPTILVEKWKFYLCMFDDHWGRKHALLDYKKLDITKLPCWDFYIEG